MKLDMNAETPLYMQLKEAIKAAIKDGDRTCGYPSIVNLVKVAKDDLHLQAALAAVFTI